MYISSLPLNIHKYIHLLPLLHSCMISCRKPVAEILKSETIESSDAPLVAFFSARGPNLIVHDVLKVNIPHPFYIQCRKIILYNRYMLMEFY